MAFVRGVRTGVVVDEGCPRLTTPPGLRHPLRTHVPLHRALDAEFEQSPADAFRPLRPVLCAIRLITATVSDDIRGLFMAVTDLTRQTRRKTWRCQHSSVSGWTMSSGVNASEI